MNLSHRQQEGFTILELVIVCALLAVMSTVLYGVISGIIRGRNAILAENELMRTTRSIITRLNRELTSRVAEPLSEPNASSVGESGEPNPSNPYAALSPQFMMRRMFIASENKKVGDIDADTIRFISDGSAQEFLSASGNKGRVEIAYRIEVDPKEDQPTSQIKRYTLVRDEYPSAVGDSVTKEAHRVTFPLANNVASLNFRYLKDDKWLDEWSSNNTGLPEAIEIRIQLIASNDKIESVATTIALARKSRPLSTFQLGTN